MSDIEMNLHEILSDRSRLQRLFMLEKERRGVPKDALAFVGMANVASHWWCTQQAVLKSRANELEFFLACLSDRVGYANRLGLVSKLPTSDDALLDVGKEITLAQVEKLLRAKEQKIKELAKSSARPRAALACTDCVDSAGNRTRMFSPDLPPEERKFLETQAAAEGIRVIDLEEDPKRRGVLYQALRAEQYPSIRWNFSWGQYTVVGVPDGITGQFVYEYKTTRRQYYLRDQKPKAFAQADLYGFFFRRPKKRVQIHVVEEDATQTWEEPVDAANAENTLAAFARVDAGELPQPPPAWKCRVCDFRATCPISRAK